MPGSLGALLRILLEKRATVGADFGDERRQRRATILAAMPILPELKRH